MENIDYEKLREDLINYYGSATTFYPASYMDVIKVQNANNEELIYIAQQNNFDLEDYKVHTRI